jgi:hypothetical protein
MEADIPGDKPAILLIWLKKSRLMIPNIYLIINVFLFGFNNNLYGAFRTGIDFATHTCKTIATGTVCKVPFKGSPAFVAKNDPDQYIHSVDDSLSNLLQKPY